MRRPAAGRRTVAPGRLRAMMTTFAFFGAAVFAAGQQPTLLEFARGTEIAAPGSEPVARVTLPEHVYTTSVKSGLADLRVFNRAGTPVPHALRRPPAASARAGAEVDAPVFPLSANPRDGRPLAQVAIGAGGAVVQLRAAPPRGAAHVAYVVDASAVEGPLARLSLRWESPAGETFLAAVDVEGSYDLNTWTPLASSATIGHLRSGDRELRQADIPLEGRRARYLRVSWPPALEAVRLTGARVQREAAVPAPAISWTVREPAPARGGAAEFDTGGPIPVEHLDLELADEAADAALVTFSSRAAPDAPWQVVRQDVVWAVTQAGRTVRSAPLRIAPMTHRYWRVEVARDGGWAADRLPRLKLGWHPDELLFLTQGGGPFTLAYGSARVEAGGAPIEALLRGTEDAGLEDRVQAATLGPSRELGGPAALTPPRSWRRIALWAALVVAVAGLAALAYRVSRDMRDTPPHP